MIRQGEGDEDETDDERKRRPELDRGEDEQAGTGRPQHGVAPPADGSTGRGSDHRMKTTQLTAIIEREGDGYVSLVFVTRVEVAVG